MQLESPHTCGTLITRVKKNHLVQKHTGDVLKVLCVKTIHFPVGLLQTVKQCHHVVTLTCIM